MCKRENKEVVRDLENTKQRRKKKHPYPQITTTAAKLKENILVSSLWVPEVQEAQGPENKYSLTREYSAST